MRWHFVVDLPGRLLCGHLPPSDFKVTVLRNYLRSLMAYPARRYISENSEDMGLSA